MCLVSQSSKYRSDRIVSGLRIGLLGGSFNPAHRGHIHISQMALRQLNLDQVWWLVSPKNPLKNRSEMAPFHQRFGYAAHLTRLNRSIVVSDYERSIKTAYTAETLTRITDDYPDCSFVWLMGRDNWLTIHLWDQWRTIFNTVPVAVFPRRLNLFDAVRRAPADLLYDTNFYPPTRNFISRSTPAWTELQMPELNISATELRRNNTVAWSSANHRQVSV